MNEFSFIDLIKQPYYKQSTLIKGIGDDAAVLRQSSQDIVTAVDTFVEGVHFTRKTMPPFYIGYRALAANISDLAGMGASPTFYLVSITIPKTWTEYDLESIFLGMRTLAKDFKMDLIGGDTVSGSELVLSITVIGYVDKGKARFRNQARDGDIVFVTGTLGDSQAGLHILLNKTEYRDTDYYIKRHQKPTPRIKFALALKNLTRVSLNDISDGLGSEAGEIAEASKIDLIIQDEHIPTSSYFHQFPPSLQNQWKYFGGEDFELLGTVPKNDFNKVRKAAEDTNTMVTQIGYALHKESDDAKVFLEANHCKKLLNKDGYIHLK